MNLIPRIIIECEERKKYVCLENIKSQWGDNSHKIAILLLFLEKVAQPQIENDLFMKMQNRWMEKKPSFITHNISTTAMGELEYLATGASSELIQLENGL